MAAIMRAMAVTVRAMAATTHFVATTIALMARIPLVPGYSCTRHGLLYILAYNRVLFVFDLRLMLFYIQ